MVGPLVIGQMKIRFDAMTRVFINSRETRKEADMLPRSFEGHSGDEGLLQGEGDWFSVSRGECTVKILNEGPVVLTTIVKLLLRISRPLAKFFKGKGKPFLRAPLRSRWGFTSSQRSHGPSLLGTGPLA